MDGSFFFSINQLLIYSSQSQTCKREMDKVCSTGTHYESQRKVCNLNVHLHPETNTLLVWMAGIQREPWLHCCACKRTAGIFTGQALTLNICNLIYLLIWMHRDVSGRMVNDCFCLIAGGYHYPSTMGNSPAVQASAFYAWSCHEVFDKSPSSSSCYWSPLPQMQLVVWGGQKINVLVPTCRLKRGAKFLIDYLVAALMFAYTHMQLRRLRRQWR